MHAYECDISCVDAGTVVLRATISLISALPGWRCCISYNKLAEFHSKWPILLGIVAFFTTLARITLNNFNKVVQSTTLHVFKISGQDVTFSNLAGLLIL